MSTSEIIIFTTDDGKVSINTQFNEETVWLSLDEMAELFDRNKSTISRHINNVFEEGELERNATVAKFVRWYNTEHRHSALNYVTPQQRHTGEADQILAQRKQVIEAAKAANPQRWSGSIRNLSLPDSVTLNLEKAVNC